MSVFTDSQATLRRIQSDTPEPRQAQALRTINWESEFLERNVQVEYRWVPADKGLKGNEKADQQATRAAYEWCGRKVETQMLPEHLDYVYFSHMSRKLTELKWEKGKEKIKEKGKKSKHSYQYDLVKRGGNSAVMESKKPIVVRFYQLKTGHALLGKYLQRIGTRRDMKCWWCGHEYQTRDHLFKWCKRWKQEQKQLWDDSQEG